jgi:hypothetical protein
MPIQQFIADTGLMPEETAESGIRRAAVLAGIPVRRFVCQLTGRARVSMEGFPEGIDAFCAGLSSFPSAETIISRHSLYDYSACCASEAGASMLERAMHRGTTGPVRPCHLPVSVMEGMYAGAMCPLCDERDLDRYGATYVHRFHVPTFVHVCPVHGEVLRYPTSAGECYLDTCHRRSMYQDDQRFRSHH